MKSYTKTVRAIQYTGDNDQEVIDAFKSMGMVRITPLKDVKGFFLLIERSGQAAETAGPEDWIVADPELGVRVCGPAAFSLSYVSQEPDMRSIGDMAGNEK